VIVVNIYAWTPIVATATRLIYLGRGGEEGDKSREMEGDMDMRERDGEMEKAVRQEFGFRTKRSRNT